jgi:excinuclease ABC subunit A
VEQPELRVEGATEHNLRDVDVAFGAGVTAVVGVSGSGKSSLVFDTVYHEARRRFLETLSLGSPALRLRPARVRDVVGLRPAVAVGQNVVNRNPHSTVATAAGIHPFLRVLYARFGQRHCGACGVDATIATLDAQVALLRQAAARSKVAVIAPLVRAAEGSHTRLLATLSERFDRLIVDGEEWTGAALDPDRRHDLAVHLGTAHPGDSITRLRRLLESAAALGAAQVTLHADGDVTGCTLSRAPLCPGCGTRLPSARPTDFRTGAPQADSYRLAGLPLPALLRLDVAAAEEVLATAELPPAAGRALEQVRRRLRALVRLGLGYLPLQRPSPTLSRGEAQRLRLAVILANDIEDLLHVVDEPTIGLDPAGVRRLLTELGRLRGPVLLVEHDRAAVAAADHVIELGPGAGPHGGQVVFEGVPAALWRADTASGRCFSQRARPSHPPPRRAGPTENLAVRGADAHNLRGVDCDFPIRALTVVTGPSGAGKTTLVRDVLAASLTAGEPRGCRAVHGPPLRPVLVDQSPIGRNPRSSPATYTGLAERIRTVFARATGLPASAFSFNRPDGACQECQGMGAVEVKLAYLPSEWLPCEGCRGERFAADVRDAVATLDGGRRLPITEVYHATVDQAASLLAGDARAARIVAALQDVGLGYLRLGQPSPTLSGGEAQRVKLAKQFATVTTGQLVVLDEPTTGLHPADLSHLLAVLHRLVDAGATAVVVEHHPAVIAAADRVVRLGPGGGPHGGRLVRAGPPDTADDRPPRPRARARTARRGHPAIRVRGATANNLRGISLEIPKPALTAVVGVSGSGKSSLVRDVLAAEANRRLLESLSMYERQSVQEGPAAPVEAVTGLGPTVSIGAQPHPPGPRSTVGSASELSFHLGVLLAYAGERDCPACGATQRRHANRWRCVRCDAQAPAPAPSDFSPATYEAACLTCHGVGTVPQPRTERMVTRPDLPICAGALHSPGFFPHSYLSRPEHGGYWMLQAIAQRYGFDPFTTPFRDLSDAAREAFLFGEEEVTLAPQARRMPSKTVTWRGVLRIVSHWDTGGRYTDHPTCPTCDGERLRPANLAVRLAGSNRHALHHEPTVAVARTLATVDAPVAVPGWVHRSLRVARARLGFLDRVGLGYLHLDRILSTLSAGEGQRVRLASLLGAQLTGMTVLLDEPSRGMHPREVDALADTLAELRRAGNTVVAVDHDRRLVERAEQLVVLGPGAGRDGGAVVAAGAATAVRRSPAARSLLAPPVPARARAARREPSGELVIRAPRAHHFDGRDVAVPLGCLVGVCGVSGSGKSTLAIGTLARALAPRRDTASVPQEGTEPAAHDRIDGAPARAIHCDQSRAGIRTPGAFLAVMTALRRAYAASDEAAATGLAADDLVPRCDACRGRGSVREEMGFLPAVERPCDVCDASGYRPEARELAVRGWSLPQLESQTLDEVAERWGDLPAVARPLRVAARLGLGYLTVGQRSRELSGGERQRLRLARELARPTRQPTLYILDEPTVGLHATDVNRLVDALDGLVSSGHSVLVVDHDPVLLACCDRLVELGPGGGPDGGRVLTELLDVPADDPEVVDLARRRSSEVDELARQRPQGLKATAWLLARLAYLGADRGDPRVAELAERVLSWQCQDGSFPLTAFDTGDRYDMIPLQTALPLRGLTAVGYGDDERVERAYDWLLAQRLDDGSWPTGRAAGQPGYVAGYRRLPGSRGCRANTQAALASLVLHPWRRCAPETRRALDLLLQRETRDEWALGTEISRLRGYEPATGFITFYARFDLAYVLEIASRAGATVADERVADLVGFLRARCGEAGLWEHPAHPELTRWLTVDILASLRRLADGDWAGVVPRVGTA